MAYLFELTTERAATVIVSLLLFAMSSRVAVDPDMWWHLRLGEYIMENGRPAYTDIFSHSNGGELHRNHSWLAQVIMLSLWRLSGHLGLTLFVSSLATGGMLLLFRAGSGSIYMQGFVLVFGAACAGAFWSPRPQMFTFFFSALLVYLLYDLKLNGRDRLLWLPLLMWFWVQCHGGYIIGLLLITVFALAELTNNAFAFGESPVANHKICKLISVLLLSLALMPLNPLGLDIFVVPFDTIGISGLREYIQEWQSPDLSQPYTWGFIILLMLLLGAIVTSRRRLDLTEAFFVVGTLCLALLSGRNLPLFAIAAVPITTSLFDEALKRRGWSIRRRRREAPYRVVINLALILLVAFGALLHLEFVSNEKTVEAAISQNWPVDAVRHLNATALEGNLFNSYNWGGYLIYAAQQHPVFIDGRTDLHHELLADYIAAMDAQVWREIFEKWNIGIVMIESSSPLAERLAQAAEWRLDYADDVASIYLRLQP